MGSRTAPVCPRLGWEAHRATALRGAGLPDRPSRSQFVVPIPHPPVAAIGSPGRPGVAGRGWAPSDPPAVFAWDLCRDRRERCVLSAAARNHPAVVPGPRRDLEAQRPGRYRFRGVLGRGPAAVQLWCLRGGLLLLGRRLQTDRAVRQPLPGLASSGPPGGRTVPRVGCSRPQPLTGRVLSLEACRNWSASNCSTG